MFRSGLGPEHVPGSSKGSGYRLIGVSSDWHLFCDLANRATSNRDTKADLLGDALCLVRGAPFTGVVPGTYTWAWTELLYLKWKPQLQIITN